MSSPFAPSRKERDSPPGEMQELEVLRRQLMKAQRAENTAIRRLSELTAVGAMPSKAAIDAAMTDVHVARMRAVAAYDAWSRGVEHFKEIHGQTGTVGAALDGGSQSAPFAQ